MTEIGLREFIEHQIQGLKDWVASELAGRDAGVLSSKTELDRRLHEMNELRKQIETERGIYLAREEYERRHEDLRAQMVVIAERLTASEGRDAGITSTVGWVLASAGVIIALAALLISRV